MGTRPSQDEDYQPLAALEVVGYRAANASALAPGLSRRHERWAREGAGLVTDLPPELWVAVKVRDICRSLSGASFANCCKSDS